MWIITNDTLINLDMVKYIKKTDATQIEWLENGRTQKTKVGKKLFAVLNDDTFIDIVIIYDKDCGDPDYKVAEIGYQITRAIESEKNVIYISDYK